MARLLCCCCACTVTTHTLPSRTTLRLPVLMKKSQMGWPGRLGKRATRPSTPVTTPTAQGFEKREYVNLHPAPTHLSNSTTP